VLLTGCFCIGPGIDSRLAVLAHRPVGLRANTADRESIPGPIQKQPVRSDPGIDSRLAVLARRAEGQYCCPRIYTRVNTETASS
jgi:hypothetical protein